MRWGEGRGVSGGLWRELVSFHGRVSRRQFLVLLLAWVVAGAGLVFVATGDVAWVSLSGLGISGFAAHGGSGWGVGLIQGLLWSGGGGGGGGGGVLLSLVVVFAPLLMLPVVGLVLVVVPAEGWWARWVFLRKAARGESGPRRGAGVREAVVEEAGSRELVAAVERGDVPVLDSVEEMRDWLYGDEGQ